MLVNFFHLKCTWKCAKRLIGENMRLLILSETFPPETKSASTLFFELAESFVKKGHQVSVVTRMSQYNIADGVEQKNVYSKEVMDGINVYRFKVPTFVRNIPLIRGLEHFILSFILFLGALRLKNSFDVILVYSPPLPLGLSGYFLGKIKKAKVIVNIQDLYPQTVIDLGLLKNKYLIKLAKAIEFFVYSKSDFITVHSEGNRKYVIEKGAGDGNCEVIHNWVDTERIKPGPKLNDFSRKYNLYDKFVISFAGVIGFAQDLEVVIDAALILKEYKDILFVLVGDGTNRNNLIKKTVKFDLKNILFVQTQPLDKYPYVLNASDVCLVTLRKNLLTPVVPGKLLSIMASGRPVLASIPLMGDAPKIIEESNCGISVEAGRPDELASAILKLYNNVELCRRMGENGRRASEAFFSRDVCISKYEKIMQSLLTKV